MWSDNGVLLGAMRALALLTLSLGAAPSVTPRSDFWVPDGPVHAILEHRGVIYVAGNFEYVSPVSETGGAFETVSGFAVPDFPRFAGAIKAIVPDNAGGWFIGGQFTSAGGYPITNLAHVHSDRTIDAAWTPNPDDAVLALASDGTRLFAGGSFTSIAGAARNNLAALHPQSGAAIEDWQADCTLRYGNATVTALTVGNGRLYVAGYFSYINGEPREYVGSVDAATGDVDSWHPNGFNATAASSQINAIAISGNVLYVGGTFAQLGGDKFNGIPRQAVGALDVLKNTNSILSWSPGANGAVKTIAVSCGIVYLGGSFTSVDGQPRQHFAAVEAATGRVTPWKADANGDVLSLTLSGDTLYVGGKFTELAGESRKFLAQVDTATGRVGPWKANADFGVSAISASGPVVVAGGALGFGGKLRHHLAAFDAKSSRLLDFAPNVSGITTNSAASAEGVYALAALQNTIYLGGPFTSVNGEVRNHLAAVGTDGALLPWNPDVDGIVEALAVSGDTVYVGGFFSTLNGVNRQNVAAVRAGTNVITDWNPQADGKVQAIQPRDGQIYVGGSFTRIGGKPRTRIAALRANDGTVTEWRAELNHEVRALDRAGARLFCGGAFSQVNGEQRDRAIALTARGTANCWDPRVRYEMRATEIASAVNAVSVMDRVVYLGGAFNQVGGEVRNGLAAVSSTCPATLLPWNPAVDDDVNVITTERGVVYVGGRFQRVAGLYRPNFAVFAPERSPVITLHPTNQLVAIGEPTVVTAAASGPGKLRYQWQRDGVNIPGATSHVFAIPSVQPADAGEYVLVTSNRFGQVLSHAATITLLQPLTVVSQPASMSLAAGETAILSVQVDGSPTPYFQWRRNGVNIPGANAATLLISNAQPTDGGSYEVVADNLADAITSDVATLRVISPALPFADDFESRGDISSLSGIGSGNNFGATHQPGETNHAAVRGNSSIWIDWVSPTNGIATFSTLGSDFDTILAVYTGDTLTNHSHVAADDDRGDFYTSDVSFYAAAGTVYSIVVDGFSGASGNVVLRWDVDISPTPLPRITIQPRSLVVIQGETATFSVGFIETNAPRFQWFLGCDAIPDATNSTLTVANVQPGNVGNYRVTIENGWHRVVESADAALEIGPESDVSTSDKEEDLAADAPLLIRRNKASGAPGIISVSAGTIDHQLFNNFRARTSLRETNHCRISGGASRFLDLHAAESGVFIIDTVGSTLDTVLAAYFRTNLANLSANQIACNNNATPDRVTSLVRFEAIQGRNYRAFVDGVRGSKGKVTLNWRLGQVPLFAPSPTISKSITAAAGTVLEAVLANSEYPVLRYQWMRDGMPLSGATNVAWLVRADSAPGQYSVVAENRFGFATNLVAVFTDSQSPINSASLLGFSVLGLAPRLANGSFGLLVEGPSETTFVLETSSDLVHWIPVSTNLSGGAPTYIQLNTPASAHQFFRARTVDR